MTVLPIRYGWIGVPAIVTAATVSDIRTHFRYRKMHRDVSSGHGNPMIISLPQPTDRAVSQQDPGKPEGRILPFRQRGSLLTRNVPRPPASVPDLEKYERARNEPDDFRHRMVM